MKVKNNTNKPIGIGTLNLLPGKTEVLPAPYENHPVVEMYAAKKYDEEHTYITLIADKKSAKKEATEEVTAPAEETTEEVKATKGKRTAKGADNGSEQ